MPTKVRGRRLLVLSAVAAMITSLLAGTAAADTEVKQFEATVTVTPAAGGAMDATATFSLTNLEGTPHELGSANVYAPAAFGGQVFELRNLTLQSGETHTFETSFDIPCGSVGTHTWVVEAKQSNDFNGSGNDFIGNSPDTIVSSDCSLAFGAEPADAERFAGIASVPNGDPADDPIEIQVLDGAGNPTELWPHEIALEFAANPGGASLSGGTAYAGLGGVAAFSASPPSIDVSAAGYSLQAFSSDGSFGMTSSPSGFFSIFDDYVDCGGGPCSAYSSAVNGGGTTEASVSSDGAGAIVLSVGGATSTLDCPGLDEVSSTVEFDVLYSALGKTVSLTWTPWLQPARKYEICWGSPSQFTTSDGTDAQLIGGLYVGILPNCKKNEPGLVPCVVDYDQNRKAGSVTFTILAPPGDPVIRVG